MLFYVVDLPIAENQRRRQFEAAKHMTSGRGAAPSGLANPEEIHWNLFHSVLLGEIGLKSKTAKRQLPPFRLAIFKFFH